MGTVVWLKNIRIEVRTREKNHIGRPHCHAVGRGGDASIDLASLQVLETNGFSSGDIEQILAKIREYQTELVAKWEEYHGKEKNKLHKK